MLWTIISFSIIGTFAMMLVGIWKMDLLKDYRRMYWKNPNDEKQICKTFNNDVSMYPSAHQSVPTLFPHDLSPPNDTSNTLPFG